MSDFDNNSFSNGSNGFHREQPRYKGENVTNNQKLFESGNDNEVDLRVVFGVLLKYKWWVIGITLLCFGGAYLYANLAQPIYESSGTVLITQENSQYPMKDSDLSYMMSSTFGVGAGNRLENEMEILQSRSLSSEIAKRLLEEKTMENGENFPILWYNYPEDSTLIPQSAVAQRIKNKMILERTDQDTDVIRIRYESYSPFEAKRLVDITIDTYIDVSIRQKRTEANSALSFLESELDDVESNLESAEVALKDYRKNTNLVEVDGQTNAVITRMAELESQMQEVQVQRVSISSSIESYENQLEQIKPGLAEQFAENISGRLEGAQLRLAELRTAQSLMLQRNPGLQSNPESEPQFIRNQEEIRTVREEIREITNNLLNADDSDVYIGFLEQEDGGVTNRILELRKNLIELKIQESQLNAQEEVIQQRMAEENQFFDGLPENMLELARLQREVKISEELFTTISNQFAETQLWEQTQFGAGRPIDYGYLPEDPSSPNKILYSLIGLIIGFTFGIGFVVIRSSLNSKIDGAEKLKDAGFRLLSVIPDYTNHVKEKYNGQSFVHVKDKKVSTGWETILDSISPISEAYRRLQNNIIFSDPDTNIQTIVVTSSQKSEGKTTVSANLAVSLAEGGKKVLLIDSDLRRPNIHTFTGEAREPGLSEVFYDDKSLSTAIKPTIAPAVEALTAGHSIPNPAAVMQSKKLKSFLSELKHHYDHIIIDTPPFGVITDAAPLMQNADGVILVARFGQTQTYQLEQTIENLKGVNANIIGTVLTAYKHSKSAEYYNYNYKYNNYEAYKEYQET